MEDIGEIITGTTPPTKDKDNYGGTRLFVSPADIQGNRYVTTTNTTLTDKGYSLGRELRGGTSLFVSIGSTIGKVAQIKDSATSNQQINAVVPYTEMDDDFVFSMLENASDKIKKLSAQQAVPIINKTTFGDIEINHPKKDEQTKIGLLFSDLDNLITLHQCKHNYTPITFSFQKANNSTPSWEQRKFPEFVEFYNGLTYTPGDVQESGTLVLRSSNVKNGEIADADNVYVNPEIATSENVRKGDIIVVVRNGSRALIGKHAEIKESMPNTVIGAFMTGIRSEHSSFVNALLGTAQFEKEIEKNMGATINQITGYMFSKMEFMIPGDEEQEAIGKYFKEFDNLITLHQR